jgi:GT2 family glycosyltransferase
MVSIIIVNHNGKEFTAQCVRSLKKVRSPEPYEIIVVDNASEDGTAELLQKECADIVFLPQERNKGFGAANNIGAQKARGEYLFFVNNDIVFKKDALAPLKDFLDSHEHAGAVAPMLLNADGRYQVSHAKYPSLTNEFRTKIGTVIFSSKPKDLSPRQVEWVSFAAVMIRKNTFEMIRGFDERYFMYFEDADICYRLKNAGFPIYFYAAAECIHLGGKSWSPNNTAMLRKEYRRSQILFYACHRSRAHLMALRLYLIIRFGFLSFSGDKNARQQARFILSTAILPHANRS